VSGILHAAAAVAEAAAAAAVGFALGGRVSADEQQQAIQEGAATGAADLAACLTMGSAAPAKHAAADATSQEGSAAIPPIAADRKDKLLQDSVILQPTDSFNCPPFIPMAGGSASSKSGLNPFTSGGSGLLSFPAGQLQSMNSTSSNNGDVAAFHIGTAVAQEPGDACTPAAIQQLQQQLQESGSPSAATAALLRKGQLLPPAASVEGSEWGSGALLGPHITSGIDSPTGSAVFRANPFDAGSECGSLPGGGSELATAFESLSTTGAGVKASIGASRMGREAAGAAASTLPFGGWATLGSTGASIHEIVPASSDSDSDSEKIASCYYRRRSSGDMQHHSRLAVESHEQADNAAQQAPGPEQGVDTQQQGLGFEQQEVGFEQPPASGFEQQQGAGYEQQQAVGFEQQQAVGFEQQQAVGFEQQQVLGFEQQQQQPRPQSLGFGDLQGVAGFDDTALLGFGHRQMLGFSQPSQVEPGSKATSTGLMGFAAAQAEATIAAAAVAALPEGHNRSSAGGSSVSLLPPTYSEAVAGADADDECSSAGTADSPRRVWPADYAHSAAAAAVAAAAASSDGGSSMAVRHGAELTEQQQQPALAAPAASASASRTSSRQLQDTDSAATVLLNSSSNTGLVRRSVSRPTSRTPSQILPAGAAAAYGASMSVDGMVQLPTPGYEYADDDNQPLVPQLMGDTCGQVSTCCIPGSSSCMCRKKLQRPKAVVHTALGRPVQHGILMFVYELAGANVLQFALLCPALLLLLPDCRSTACVKLLRLLLTLSVCLFNVRRLQMPGALAAAHTQVGRVALHTLLANSAQWFDLLVFVVLGGQLAAAMVPPHLTQHQQLGLLFAIFAAGHVLWLAGCFVWPWLSARVGRRTVLAWTVGLSAFPTALLGCMPTYPEVRAHAQPLSRALCIDCT
jgi:hypothetical protein